MFLYLNRSENLFLFATSKISFSRFCDRYLTSLQGQVKNILNFDLSKFTLLPEGWDEIQKISNNPKIITNIISELEKDKFTYLGEFILVNHHGFVPDINGGLYEFDYENLMLADGWYTFLKKIEKPIFGSMVNLSFDGHSVNDDLKSLIIQSKKPNSVSSRLELFKYFAFPNYQNSLMNKVKEIYKTFSAAFS